MQPLGGKRGKQLQSGGELQRGAECASTMFVRLKVQFTFFTKGRVKAFKKNQFVHGYIIIHKTSDFLLANVS